MRIERLRVYPVKGLHGVELDAVGVREGGTLAADREYALVDAGGETINGKQTDRVHDLRTRFDPDTHTLGVRLADESAWHRFELAEERGRERATEWFDGVFDIPVTLQRNAEVSFVDRPSLGASVVSTATLEAVASWFDDLTVDGVRRRLRANVEVGGVPAFWEDRFVGEDAPAFTAAGVRFEGGTPCARCVVPQRDPDTGEPAEGFRERFVRQRERTFPEWADESAFDHFYTLMLIADVTATESDPSLRVGQSVHVESA
ncbi:MAG: MOSC domain-containing protein [Halolamina sp.]